MDFPAGPEATILVEGQASDIVSSAEDVEAARLRLNLDDDPPTPDGTARRDVDFLAGQEATILDEGQASDILSSAEDVEAARLRLNLDDVPPIPDGTARRDVDFPAGQEATIPVEGQASDIVSSAEDDEAARFWLNLDDVPPTSDGMARRDVAHILLAEAARLEQDALQLRANMSTASQRVDTKPKTQTLLTRFFDGKLSKERAPPNFLSPFRGSRGAPHPSCQTQAERNDYLKRRAIQAQAKDLFASAKRKENACAEIRALVAQKEALLEQADALLVTYPEAEFARTSAEADPLEYTCEQMREDDAEVRPIDNVRSECQQVLQQLPARKRGRPCLTLEERALRFDCSKRRKKGAKLQPQDRWRMQTPTATARKDLVERLDKMASISNEHQHRFWQNAEEKLGLSRHMLKRFIHPEERTKLQKWLADHPQRETRGSKRRGWKKFESQDTGCRIAADGGKKKTNQSQFKDQMERVREWSDRQMAMGHDLSGNDLVEEFRLTLESTVFELQETRDRRSGLLTESEERLLQACAQRIENVDTRWGFMYTKARLCHECQFTEHNPSNVVPFSNEENDIVCLLSWQSWDYLMDIIARSTLEELRAFVADPDGFVNNRQQVALCYVSSTRVFFFVD